MLNRHTSFTDLLYLNNGDVAKAARAANLPLPKEYAPPTPSNSWKVKDLKDLIGKTNFDNVENKPIVVIDSMSEYSTKGN